MNFLASALGDRRGDRRGDLGKRSTSLPDLRERISSLPRVGSWSRGRGSLHEHAEAPTVSEGPWEAAARGGSWPTVVEDEPLPPNEGSSELSGVRGKHSSRRHADDVQVIAAEEVRFALDMERARLQQDENAEQLRQLEESAKLQEEQDAARLRHREQLVAAQRWSAQTVALRAAIQPVYARRNELLVQRKAFEMSTPTWEATLSECEEMIVTVRPKALA